MIKNKKQLIKEYADLPPISDYYKTNNPEWAQNREAMRDHMEKDSADGFLRWSTIDATMFTKEHEYLDKEYMSLFTNDTDRWMKAITESTIGRPHLYTRNPKVSGNLIHQAYHLMQMEQFVGYKVHKANRIVEFGGGYGAMCAIAHRLGFKGAYHIFDLPEFSLLQEYYLFRLGILKDMYYYQVDDMGRFQPPPIFTDWLIGCFSLSEVTRGLRDAFISSTNAQYVMMAMQEFWHTDRTFNTEYSMFRKANNKYDWTHYKSETLENTRYILGVRSDN